MIIRSALRERVASAAGDAAPHVPRPRRASELAWTLLPAVMLAATLALTWGALRPPPHDTMPLAHDMPARAQ